MCIICFSRGLAWAASFDLWYLYGVGLLLQCHSIEWNGHDEYTNNKWTNVCFYYHKFVAVIQSVLSRSFQINQIKSTICCFFSVQVFFSFHLIHSFKLDCEIEQIISGVMCLCANEMEMKMKMQTNILICVIKKESFSLGEEEISIKSRKCKATKKKKTSRVEKCVRRCAYGAHFDSAFLTLMKRFSRWLFK